MHQLVTMHYANVHTRVHDGCSTLQIRSISGKPSESVSSPQTEPSPINVGTLHYVIEYK